MDELIKTETQFRCCRAPCEILHSIALEEAALSHILNAEGEKIQRAIAMEDISVEDLLCINNSVAKTVREVTSLEHILLCKLEAICSCGCNPTPPPIPQNGWICVEVKNCKTHEGLCGAKITIFRNDEIVFCGCTDHCGRFVSESLPLGCYFVKIEYKNLPAKVCKVTVDKPCCNSLDVCFDLHRPCPPVIPTRFISIRGRVTNQCGRPLSNACVLAKGVNSIEVHTDHCGFYEICQLKVTDRFCITPMCNCCTDASCECTNVTKDCYCIDLKIWC